MLRTNDFLPIYFDIWAALMCEWNSLSLGAKRLIIVLAVPYFVYWWGTGIYSQLTIWRLERANRAADQSLVDYRDNVDAVWEADAAVWRALEWGLLYPSIAFAVLLSALWVYRGFRPKQGG